MVLVLGQNGGSVQVWRIGVIKAVPVGDVHVALGKDNTAVLATLTAILRVTYLSSISKSEANPAEVYYFLPLIPDPSH